MIIDLPLIFTGVLLIIVGGMGSFAIIDDGTSRAKTTLSVIIFIGVACMIASFFFGFLVDGWKLW